MSEGKLQTYLVGGAVRDRLLGLPVHERDWVVVGADPDDLLERGYRQVGRDFPVFLHPHSNEEYALARLERKVAPGHQGFRFDTSKDVTLEQDLQRRDLTINAIADDGQGNLIDPYGGQQDLEDRILRHVSPAFSEDPLRVLRVARFAARFAGLGFTIAPETMALMRSLSDSGELQHLAGERIWQECETALRESSPAVFLRVLHQCGALAVVLPEVDNLYGVPQPEKYHPEVDTGLHIELCLEQAVQLSDDPVVRYAVLVHDVGKGVTPRDNWPHHYRHEHLGLDLLDRIRARLKVPNDYHQLARLVCEHHTKMHRAAELRSSKLLELLESADTFRRPQRLEQFLLACEADARGRTGLETRDYPQAQILRQARDAALSVDVAELLQAHQNGNLAPEKIGELVRQQRTAAIHQQLQRSN